MDDDERQRREVSDRRMNELARVEEGDGKLRLWPVRVMWTGGDDNLGNEEDREWVAKGALDVQRAYILVCIDLGFVLSVGRMLGTQNKQIWIVRARNRKQAESAARMSPLGELRMAKVLDSETPVDPVAMCPELAKLHTVDRRHPVVERVLNGMTFDEVAQWILEDEPDDPGYIFKMMIIWNWARMVDTKAPEITGDGFCDRHWEHLVTICQAHLRVVEESDAKIRAEDARARRTRNQLAEWGIDPGELRRFYDAARARGETPNPEDFPLNHKFLQADDEDEEP